MKICFFCDSIFTFGGVQRVVAVIAKALSVKHEITILTMDDSSIEDTSMYNINQSTVNIRYFKYPSQAYYLSIVLKTYSFFYKRILPKNKFTSKLYSYSSFSHTYRKSIKEYLNQENYDIVIGVHAFISLRLAIIRKELNAQKVIGWMHSSYDAFFNTPKLYLWNQKEQFQFESSNLDQIIVLSKSDQSEYKHNMNLKTSVIMNPLTLEPQNRGKKSYKTFLAIGRLSFRTKGFDLLIKAFALFAKTNSDWQLHIVGEGQEKEFLLNLIKQNNLTDRIFIHPFTKDIGSFYSSASVFVLSSRWEGFGLVLCEAMAHGLPIIASNLPVVKEVLVDKNSLIFEKENIRELADRMTSIINMDLDKMGNASIEQAKKFDLTIILKQWEEVLFIYDEQ